MEQGQLVQYENNLAACYEAEYLLSMKIQEEMCKVNGLCRNREYSYDDSSEVSSAYHQRTHPKMEQQSHIKPGDCSSFLRGANGYQNGMMNSSTISPSLMNGMTTSQPSDSTAMDFMSYGQTQTAANMPLFQAQGSPHCASDITARYSFPYTQGHTNIDELHKQHDDDVHGEGPRRKKHKPEY